LQAEAQILSIKECYLPLVLRPDPVELDWAD